MRSAVLAGIYYFIGIFGLGFILGTLRVLFLIPRIGELGAVAMELPVMLGASWLACGLLVRRICVPRVIAARLIMGGLAFTLLMLAEIGVSVFAFGRTIAEHAATYLTPSAQAGLAAQLVFAAIPFIHLWTDRRAQE